MWKVWAKTGGAGEDVRNVIAEEISEAADKAAELFNDTYGSEVGLRDIFKIELLGTED